MRRAPFMRSAVLILALLAATIMPPHGSYVQARGSDGGGGSGGTRGTTGAEASGPGGYSQLDGSGYNDGGEDVGAEGGAGSESVNGGGKYAEIHVAVTRGNVAKLNELLAEGVDVDLRTEEGFTTLHIAVARSQPEIVRVLLEAHADVTIGDKMAQHTPLHLACVAGNVQVVRLLLEYGANVEQVDKAGFYPFHHAVAHKNSNIVEFMLKQKFDPNIASHKDGVTALHMAAEFDHREIIHLLLAHGAAVDQPDMNKLTPLHRATMADNSIAAKILLQWGADVLAENKDLRTPLKLAQYMAHNNTVEVLQQHARQEAEMMMAVRSELTEKRKQQTTADAEPAYDISPESFALSEKPGWDPSW